MTKIVVADDEADILDSTNQVLSMQGFTVTTVQDSRRILATLRQVQPDILLQDVNMPHLNLHQLVPQIRADPRLKGVRVLLFTASVDAESMCEQLGADGTIQKPFDAQRVKKTLDAFLKQKPKRRN